MRQIWVTSEECRSLHVVLVLVVLVEDQLRRER